MKKILFLGAMVLVLQAPDLFSQKAKESGYPFEVGKKDATAMFAEKIYDEVWVATIKALVALDYTPMVAEKEAGVITAGKGATSRSASLNLGNDLSAGRSYPIEENLMRVMIETQGDKVTVSLKLHKTALCAAFFNKVAELLYGKVEKK